MKNNQNNQKSGRGGRRANAGRPRGSTNKITPTELLDDFRNQSGVSFEQFVNQQILAAHRDGDRELVSKYLLGFARYVVQDRQEVAVDHTTQGERMAAPTIYVLPKEIPGYDGDKPS